MEYGLKAVSAYLGVSVDTVRKWESRYGVVSPRRRSNGYRSYSAEDLEKLRAFAQSRRAGLGGGQAARAARRAPISPNETSRRIIAEALAAVAAFDRRRLESAFERSASRGGLEAAMSGLWLPMMAEIGVKALAKGGFWIAAEHFASAFLRERLLSAAERHRPSGAPIFALTSLSNDRHELGMLAALCRLEGAGVRCLYLGPDLPQEALTAALARLPIRGLGLSLTLDRPRREMRALLEKLRRRFPRLKVYLCGRGSLRHANLCRELQTGFIGIDLARGVERVAVDLGAAARPAASAARNARGRRLPS